MSHSKMNTLLDNTEEVHSPVNPIGTYENKDSFVGHLESRANSFASSIGRKIEESSFIQEESKYGDLVYSFKLKPQEEKNPITKNEQSPKSTEEEIRSLSPLDFLIRYNKVYRELTGIIKVLLLGAINTPETREHYNNQLIHFEMLLICKKYGANPECIMSHEDAQSPFILSIFNNKMMTTTVKNETEETNLKMDRS